MAVKINKNLIIEDSDINLNDLVPQNSNNSSTKKTYSCNYVNNQLNMKQQKVKTIERSLTTDANGNVSLNMSITSYAIISVAQKGTSVNGWVTTYAYNGVWYIHTGQFNGTALSATATFVITYIEL